jgi:UDP-glucose 4-epimerase
MFANDKCPRYNLGNAKGLSVKRVIDVAKDVSGNDFKVSIEPPAPVTLRYSLPTYRGQKMNYTGNLHLPNLKT